MGYAKGFLTMSIKKKEDSLRNNKYCSCGKTKGSYKDLVTIGVAKDKRVCKQIRFGKLRCGGDSSLMNNANIAELEAYGYKYIIGAKIKNES